MWELTEVFQAENGSIVLNVTKKASRTRFRRAPRCDEYCPHCDNHFVIDAVQPEARLHVEGDDARMDNRMLKDERVARDKERSLFNIKDVSDRIG
ncbi:hypothetical protein N7461_001839 [Penicillium sp. DV-2018c]|nr:hypothetical protein N7461_001839 [Penicillium sp. DV-2018c]